MSDLHAVIEILGKQYFVKEGQELVVDRLPETEDKSREISEVLMTTDGKSVKIGTPFVKSASVKFEVIDEGKAKKIRVATFKAKARQRRVIGHRQHISTIKINKITA